MKWKAGQLRDGSQYAECDNPEAVWDTRIMLTYLQCPHLLVPEKRAQREGLIRKYGANSNFIQSFLFGNFQRSSSEDLVFTNMDIDNVIAAMRQNTANEPMEGPRKAAIDFSGGGDDQTLLIGFGTKVTDIMVFHEKNEIMLANRFVDTLTDLGIQPWDVFADAGGLGSPCIKHMETTRKFQGMRYYLNNHRARNRKRFADRVTEDHFRLKRIFALGAITLPYNEELLRQMRRRRFVIQDHEIVKLEPKQALRNRGEKSPDILDALVMLTSEVNLDGFDTGYDKEIANATGTSGEWDKAAAPQRGRMGSLFNKHRKSLFQSQGLGPRKGILGGLHGKAE